MAVLTQNKIIEIVNDVASTLEGLHRVGIVGSYARNDFTKTSDVDLVFDMEKEKADNILQAAGQRIRTILINQFRTKLDVISYDTINKSVEATTITQKQAQGYVQMQKDLVWIWER